MAERVCVAQIGAPHGVRGEVRLRAFTVDPATITRIGPLASEDGRAFVIEALRPAKDMFIARLKGVGDRTAAEKLTNLRLYVAREALPEPEEEEFYHADLIGLAATLADGTVVGTVVAVHNFGAGDVLELRPPSGPTEMLPFTKAAVPVIDIAGRRLVIDPPDEIGEPDPSGAADRDTPS